MPKVRIVVKGSKKSSAKKEKGKKGGRPMGRTTGVNLKLTWGIAIAKGMKEKLTDEQIMKFMQKEFPENKSKQLHDVRGIPQARRHYNQGLLTGGKKPKIPAVAYGSDGKVIEGRQSHKEKKVKTPKGKEGKKGGKFRKLKQVD